MKFKFIPLLLVLVLAVGCGSDSTKSSSSLTLKPGEWEYTRIDDAETCGPLAVSSQDTTNFTFTICDADVLEDFFEEECETTEGNKLTWDCTEEEAWGENCTRYRRTFGEVTVQSEKHYEGTETIEIWYVGTGCTETTGEVCRTAGTYSVDWMGDPDPEDCEDSTAPAAGLRRVLLPGS